MLAIFHVLNVLNRSPKSLIGQQHDKGVTNIFRLQHPLPTSIYRLENDLREAFVNFLFSPENDEIQFEWNDLKIRSEL